MIYMVVSNAPSLWPPFPHPVENEDMLNSEEGIVQMAIEAIAKEKFIGDDSKEEAELSLQECNVYLVDPACWERFTKEEGLDLWGDSDDDILVAIEQDEKRLQKHGGRLVIKEGAMVRNFRMRS